MSGPGRQILGSAPYFPVPDVAAAAKHYETVLGFTGEYSAGTPPQFAIMSRDGLGIMLRAVTDASAIVPNERQGGSWDVFFWVSDAQSLYEELQGKGADIIYGPIIQQLYSMKEFAVRDTNGYILGFGQDWKL